MTITISQAKEYLQFDKSLKKDEILSSIYDLYNGKVLRFSLQPSTEAFNFYNIDFEFEDKSKIHLTLTTKGSDNTYIRHFAREL
jgi:hypothetical protein